MNNIKKYILLLFSLVLIFTASINIFSKNEQKEVLADNNPATWLLCRDDVGKAIYNGAKTDVIPFNIKSKAAVNNTESSDNIYNEILKVSGFKFGADGKAGTVNPFDRFGLAGLHFSAYNGEWKYYEVNACEEDSTKAKKSDYGKFYKDRKEPKATYDEVHTSTDVRVKQFDKGFFTHWFVAMGNTVANFFFNISKFVVTFAITLLALSFRDISEFVGFNKEITTNMFQTLYDGFFQPLVVAMFALTAINIIYKGLIKRQYREAMINGLGKTIICFACALVISTNPSFWIKIPNDVVTVVQAVFVQALQKGTTGANGDICTTDVGFSPSSSTSKDENQSIIEGAGENIRSTLGCKMWEEFLLKPWAESQFGTSYNKLESSNIKNGNQEWVKEPTVQLGSGKDVKNWALFQISTQTLMHNPVDGKRQPLVSNVQVDWYRIVDAFSNYQEKERKVRIGMDADGLEGTEGGSIGKSANAQAFFDEYGEFAKKVADEAGLYASVMLAQAALESAYGKSVSGDYNYFGIKCFDGNCKNLATSEVYNGQTVNITAGFQNFKSAEDGFEGYAHFILGRGAGANFTGGMKEKASSPREAIQNIWGAGYATDPAYVSKIMKIIETYDLTKYDTERKEQGNPEKYPIEFGKKNGSSASSGGGESDGIGMEITIPEQIPSEPLEEWQAWIGNNMWVRLGQTIVLIIFTIIGVIAPVFVGFMAAILSIGITLAMIFSPIFLLLGCWSGKGTQLFMGWLSMLMSLMMKKVVATILLVLTIIIVTSIMSLVSQIGYIKTLVFLTVVTKAIIANKNVILDKLGNINLGGINPSKGFVSSYNTTKKVGKTALATAYSTAVGFKHAAKTGDKKLDGAKSGGADYLKNTLYKSSFGRQIMQGYNNTTDARVDRYSGGYCVMCGEKLENHHSMFIDANNNKYCRRCGDENQDIEELTEIVPENKSLNNKVENINITPEEFNKKVGLNRNDKGEYSFNREETIKLAVNHIQKVDKNIKLREIKQYTQIEIPPMLTPYMNPVELQTAWKNSDNDRIVKLFENSWNQVIREMNALSRSTEEQLNNDLTKLKEEIEKYQNK